MGRTKKKKKCNASGSGSQKGWEALVLTDQEQKNKVSRKKLHCALFCCRSIYPKRDTFLVDITNTLPTGNCL